MSYGARSALYEISRASYGARSALYEISRASYGARSALYEISRASYGARSALYEISRASYGARPILHECLRAIMNTFISKFAIILPKKQIVKIRKIEADSDIDGDENHLCSRLQKFQKHLFVVCLSSLSAQAKYIFLYLCF